MIPKPVADILDALRLAYRQGEQMEKELIPTEDELTDLLLSDAWKLFTKLEDRYKK